jgi:hypothetical protein
VNTGAGGVIRMFEGTGGPPLARTATSPAELNAASRAKTATKAKTTRVVVVFLIVFSYRLCRRM